MRGARVAEDVRFPSCDFRGRSGRCLAQIHHIGARIIDYCRDRHGQIKSPFSTELYEIFLSSLKLFKKLCQKDIFAAGLSIKHLIKLSAGLSMKHKLFFSLH
jgi:hypothetical protein